MPYEWNKNSKNIGVVFEDKVVRVNDDDALDRCLKSGGRAEAQKLARDIRRSYQLRYGYPLKITTNSLGSEIYWHYRLKKASEWIERFLKKQTRPTRWMILHMDVIDCGEITEDNNRFVWDLISVYREIIGKK